MPTYDYRCNTCEKTFEVFQSFSEEPLINCPDEECEGSVKKIFSAPGISFKGSGFYKNDNRSSGSKKVDPKPEKSSSDASETSTSTKETKSSTPSSSSSSTED